MMMSMGVVVISVLVRVSVTVVSMSKGSEADDIDQEAKNTDNEKFIQSL